MAKVTQDQDSQLSNIYTFRANRVCRVVEKDGKFDLKSAFVVPGAPEITNLPSLPTQEIGTWLALMPQEFSEPEDEKLGGLVPDGKKVTKWNWEILAKPNSPQAGLLNIFLKLQLNPMYPEGVRKETAGLVKTADKMIADPTLKDLTGLPFITIDNDDSRDLDQAMWIGKTKEGWDVKYALADAAYFIKNPSPLFKEALKRGASFYLPQFTAPMLPAALSEGVISLNANVDRRALVFHMIVDKQGNCGSNRLELARIRSRAKLSYRGVQEYHDAKNAGKNHPLANQDFTETLDLLKEVGEVRMAEAQRRDVVRYDNSELSIGLTQDKTGFRDFIHQRYDTDRWNEQISLLCNEQGSIFFLQDAASNPQVQPVFRIHEKPDDDKLQALTGFIQNLISDRHLEPKDVWTWTPEKKPASYIATIKGLVKDDETRRIVDAVERQFLMANNRSVFSTDAGQHYALGIDSYARFSSPMREVVGIFTHKEALEKMYPELAGKDEWDEQLRERVIKIADESKVKQARMNKLVLELAIDEFGRKSMMVPLEQRPRYPAVIMGVAPDKVYVLTEKPREVDIKIYKDDLDKYLGGNWELIGGVGQGKLHSGVIMSPNGKLSTGSRDERDRRGRDDAGRGRGRGRGGRSRSPTRAGSPPPPNSTPATADQVKKIGGWHKELRVGDKINIIVTGYNADRNRWIFLPVA